MRLSVPDKLYARYYPRGWEHFYDAHGPITAAFGDLVARAVPPGATVLDFGAGAGRTTAVDLRHASARVCGVDIDPAVLANPRLHQARTLSPDGVIPYPDQSFDVVFADWVLEHLEDPARSLAEIARVMKPGAPFYFRTLNRSAPLCLVGRALPKRLAAALAYKLGHEPEGAGAAYVTHYRMNSASQIRRLAAPAGLMVDSLRYFETHPVYYQRFTPAWLAGLAVERLLNRLPALAPLRVNLIGCLRKPPQ